MNIIEHFDIPEDTDPCLQHASLTAAAPQSTPSPVFTDADFRENEGEQSETSEGRDTIQSVFIGCPMWSKGKLEGVASCWELEYTRVSSRQ